MMLNIALMQSAATANPLPGFPSGHCFTATKERGNTTQGKKGIKNKILKTNAVIASPLPISVSKSLFIYKTLAEALA
jgi:hypothetical protein